MTRYQWLAAVTVGATLVLIAIGAIVRTTGSGLGCPDWPLCHGQLIPPAERTAIIEYTHRTAAAIVGLLVIVTAAVTLRLRRRDRALRNLAIASLPLLALQAWLGKVTVERELPAEIVTLHLSGALLLLAVLALIAAFAFLGPERRRLEDPRRAMYLRVSISTAVLVAVALIGGSYVVGADATEACTGWPHCPEAPAPFLDGLRAQHVHWMHRLLVLAAFIGVLRLIWHARDLPEADGALRNAALGLGAMYGAQILLGAANIWTDFSAAVRAAHLAGAAATWGLCVLIVAAALYLPGRSGGARAPAGFGRGRDAARA
ncbi:MAG: heme A synthase [Chloroflexi bacterium]|nr:heme A synthase [Chloroflexota bacterium]